ncbi:MAG: 5'-nucleotidase C-terminal domain-containing protein [Bacteroidales bacterium]
MLKIKTIILALASAFVLLFSSCQNKEQYEVKSVECEQIKIDGELDSKVEPELKAMVDFYKLQIDSVMNRQIGYAAQTLDKGKPQSLLSNLTADVLRLAGAEYVDGTVSLAVMNNGGLRAPINEGPVTVGDIFKVFPFENEMVLLKISGIQVNELFKRMAAIGGEGLSGCTLVIRDNKVQSLLVNGKPVDENASYWVSTIDYLADGNSGMSVFTEAEKRINTGIRLRDVMLNYVEGVTAQGKELTSKIDDRVKVLP